tara:strand:+ start:83 stop:835 length:753 start_codon:yes stop_codon:yes gene_type:complete
MSIIKFLRNLSIALAVVLSFMTVAQAQETPSAMLNIVNNTQATLTVKVERLRGSFRENVEIEIPPVSERRTVVPAGYVTLTAIASRSSPVKTFSESFSVNHGGAYEYNIFAANFGMHALGDRPSPDNGSGLALNVSRVIHGAVAACSGGNLTAGRHWNIRNPNDSRSSSDYYEHGGYLCSDETTAFYMTGSPMLYFSCSANWTNCQRDKASDGREKPPFTEIDVGGKSYIQGRIEWLYGGYADWTLTKQQ